MKGGKHDSRVDVSLKIHMALRRHMTSVVWTQRGHAKGKAVPLKETQRGNAKEKAVSLE